MSFQKTNCIEPAHAPNIDSNEEPRAQLHRTLTTFADVGRTSQHGEESFPLLPRDESHPNNQKGSAAETGKGLFSHLENWKRVCREGRTPSSPVVNINYKAVDMGTHSNEKKNFTSQHSSSKYFAMLKINEC